MENEETQMSVVELTEATFDEVVGAGPVPVLVDVTAEWCPPCRQMEPILEELAVESRGDLVVASIDADAHPDVARRLGVMSFPTFVVFVAGAEQGRFVGARGKGRLREDLRGVLG
jgi:thioredoxin 1